MLTIDNLIAGYDKDTVLDELTLHLQPSCVHGLVGLNGSGKTTLFQCLYGFLSPQKGSINWNGQALQRKDLAMLPTQNYFYTNLTGREYLRLFPTNNGEFSVEAWQELFQLPLDELAENYSTGMKKKLAILGVLKRNKNLLLLDEPFNGIDLETSRVIQVLLRKLKEKGKTILITSHILETLTSTCDFIHHLKDKTVKRSYTPDEIKELNLDVFQELEDRVEGLIDRAM